MTSVANRDNPAVRVDQQTVQSLISAAGGATQADINAAVAALVAGAPGALDTLNELATALGDDANFATTVTNAIAAKMTNPMTTVNDVIVGGASGAPARLAKGTDGQVLTVDPVTHNLVWATPSAGFSNPMTTAGDLIYESGGDLIRGAAPSSHNATTPANLTDGDDATFTALGVSAHNNGFAIFDLGSAQSIASWRLKQTAAAPNGGSGPYDVQSSPDGTTWTTRASGVAGTADSGNTAFGAPVTARYWQFLFHSAGGAWTDSGWIVYTMSLFGSVTPARLPAGASGAHLVIDPATGLPAWANRGVLGFAAQTADQAVGVSSGAFSAVTGLGFNVTTRAERIKISFTAVATLATGGAIGVDVTIDGTRVGTGVWGLSLTDISATEGVLAFTVISPVLTAGVHAIALVARGKPAAGGTIIGSAGTGVGNTLVVETTGLTA